MAGASSEGDDNKLNTELNLVPFIDLLSSLVLFLLVTAVWLQVGTLPASVQSKGKSTASATDQNNLEIRLTGRGFKISWPHSMGRLHLPSAVVNNKGEFDTLKLGALLEAAVKSNAAALPMVAVSSDDSVEYGLVIKTIDVAKKSGFANVGLNTD